VLFAQWSLTKKQIKTFAVNSAKVTLAMRAAISTWAKTLPEGATVVCQGSTSGSKVTAFQKWLAYSRAKSVCMKAVEQRADLTYSIKLTPSSATKASARHVWMSQKPVQGK
jgi:hypothetical protein